MKKPRLTYLQFLITEILLIMQLVFLVAMFVMGGIIIWKIT